MTNKCDNLKLRCIESNNGHYTVGQQYHVRDIDGDGDYVVPDNGNDYWFVDATELFCNIPRAIHTSFFSRFERVDNNE